MALEYVLIASIVANILLIVMVCFYKSEVNDQTEYHERMMKNQERRIEDLKSVIDNLTEQRNDLINTVGDMRGRLDAAYKEINRMPERGEDGYFKKRETFHSTDDLSAPGTIYNECC